MNMKNVTQEQLIEILKGALTETCDVCKNQFSRCDACRSTGRKPTDFGEAILALATIFLQVPNPIPTSDPYDPFPNPPLDVERK